MRSFSMTRSRIRSCSRSRRSGYLETPASDSSLGYDSPETLRLSRDECSLRKRTVGATFGGWRFSRELLRCRSEDPERKEVNFCFISDGKLLLRTSSDRTSGRISLRWERIGIGGVIGVTTGIRRIIGGAGIGPCARDLELRRRGDASESESDGEAE